MNHMLERKSLLIGLMNNWQNMKKNIRKFSLLFLFFMSISCTSCRKLFIGYYFWHQARWECNDLKIVLYKDRQNIYDEYLNKEIGGDGEIEINNLKRGFVFFLSNDCYDVQLAYYIEEPDYEHIYDFLYADVSVKEEDKIMYWTITMCTIDESYVGKKIAFDRIEE